MSTPVGIIKKFVKALTKTTKTGTDAVDVALKAVAPITYEALRSKFRSDRSKSYADSGYTSYQNFLEQKCGIRVNNKDTGAITGSDAGGKITKTVESIVPETAKAKELTDAEYNSFTKNGLTVNIDYEEVTDNKAGANFNYDAETYLAKQKLAVRALYNWWIPEALDLIDESLGINFTDGRANIKEINVEFSDDIYSDRNAIQLEFDYDMGRAAEITLKINSDILYNLTASDKNGTLPNDSYISSDTKRISSGVKSHFTNYLDRLILQALAEATLKANVPYVNELPTAVIDGLVEIVGGYDDITERTSRDDYYDSDVYGYDLMRYLAKQYADGMPDGLSYNKNKTVLTATTEFNEKIIDLADFAKTVKTVNASVLKKAVYIIGNALNNSIVSGSGNDTLTGSDGADTLSGGKGNDSLVGNGGNDKLYGQAGNDKLIGNAGNDSLNGGSGADTLSGGNGNDSLTGGDGNDLFIYSGGNDYITDYEEGDRISLGAAISKASLKGSDVVLTFKNGSLAIKDGKDKSLDMINSSGKSFSTIIGGSSNSTLMTVTNSSASVVTASSDVKNIDASKRTKAVKITGNSLDNSITGGTGTDTISGGDGKDTISGGKGNDSLSGGAGNDIIWGNTGKDKLYGNAGADILSGGAGNDSLWGGAGNDTLWGNNGTDTFIFLADNSTDYIMDYDSGELLKIYDSTGKNKVSFSSSSFSNDVLTLTIKGGGTLILSDVEESTEFNINGTAYKVSGFKLAKK